MLGNCGSRSAHYYYFAEGSETISFSRVCNAVLRAKSDVVMFHACFFIIAMAIVAV